MVAQIGSFPPTPLAGSTGLLGLNPQLLAAISQGLLGMGGGVMQGQNIGQGLGMGFQGAGQGIQNAMLQARQKTAEDARNKILEFQEKQAQRQQDQQDAQTAALQNIPPPQGMDATQWKTILAGMPGVGEKMLANQYTPQEPYSSAGKLDADLKAGRITPEEHAAALKKENYIAYPQPQQPNDMQTKFSLAKQAWQAAGKQGMPDIATLQQYGVVPGAPNPEVPVQVYDPNSPTKTRNVTRQEALGQPGAPPNKMFQTQHDMDMSNQEQKLVGTLSDAATKAGSTLQNLQLMKSTLQNGLKTGFGADTAGQLGNIAQTLGLPPEVTEGLLRATDRAVFNKAAASLVQGVVGSLGTGFSNADRDFTERQVPSISNPNDATIEIMNYLEKRAQGQIDLATKASQSFYSKDYEPGATTQIYNDYLKSLGGVSGPQVLKFDAQGNPIP